MQMINRKIDQDLDQCIDLIFTPYCPQFQKCKTRMHRQHQNGANEHEKNVLTLAYRLHSATHSIEMLLEGK